MDDQPPSNNSSGKSTTAIVIGIIALLIGIVGIVLIFIYKPAGPQGPQGPQGSQGPVGPAGLSQNTILFPLMNFTITAGSVGGGASSSMTEKYRFINGQVISGSAEFTLSTDSTKIQYNGQGGTYQLNMCSDINYNAPPINHMVQLYYNSTTSPIHTITPVNNNSLTTYQGSYILTLKPGDNISANLTFTPSTSGTISSLNGPQQSYLVLTNLTNQ
jgi:hypothetical protein